MLDKTKGATITKKGKLKGRPAGSKNSSHRNDDGDEKKNMMMMSSSRNEAAVRERAENDFFGSHEESLGHLDMDSFLEGITKSEQGKEGESDDDDGSDSGNSDSDEDGDGYDDMASLDSEEEDVEASEARMKAELQKLGEKDPEFLEYLKENESGLLEFGNDDDDDDDMMDDEQKDDSEKEKQKQKDSKKKTSKSKSEQEKEEDDSFLLTPARLTSLETSAFTSHSIKGLKRILAAYRTACHLGDPSKQESKKGVRDDESDGDDDGDENGARGTKKRKKNKREFYITSPVVFDRLMATCLMNCQEEFHYHLLGDGSSGKGGTKDSKKANQSKKSNKDDSDSDSDDDGNTQTNTHTDENKPIHPRQLQKSPHYNTLHPYMESFFKSTLHLLTETGKEPRLQKFVLSALSKYIPYFSSFPRSSKPLLKACVKLWSAPLDTSQDYQMVRLQAFLRIRQLAITQPFPFIEECLKTTYLSYAQRSKFGTASNVTTVLPTLTFMGNCIVELYTLDYASAYQHAFVYIRQLALHLRTALMKKTPESVSAVYCWQYVHCLKLWVAVLSAAVGGKGSTASVAHDDDDGEENERNDAKLGGGAGKDDEANLLKSLVYPLTEIILGTVRLIPIARYVPLRLHCVRLLQQLAASTESFIPTTNILLGILDMKEIGMKPLRDGGGGKGGKSKKGGGGGGTIRGLRLPLILKLPKEGTLRTMEQLDGVLKEVFVLLNREVDLYRYSPGFPEFSFQIVQRLRKFNKEISNGRWRAYSKGTIELCEKHSTFATQARSTLVDAPKDVRRLEALKPSNMPSMRDRYDATVAKEKRLEAVTQPVVSSSAKNKGKDGKNEAKKKNETTKKRKTESDDEEDDISLDSDEDDKVFEEDDDSDDDVAKKTKSPAKQSKKKRKVAVVNEADLKNVEALKEEDEVQEGIVWSDSE